MVRSFAVLGGIAVTLAFSAVVVAGERHNYPRPCPTPCVPNQPAFGYFATTWRQWPGEWRPAQENPQSINAEVLPTPPAQEQIPLPKAAPQAKPELPSPPQAEPEGILAPQGVLPQTVLPELPAQGVPPEATLPGLPIEPKSDAPSSSLEGLLPGLPPEPNPSAIPGPFDIVPGGNGIKKDESSKPAEEPKEPPKPSTDTKPAPKARRESPAANPTVSTPNQPQRIQRKVTSSTTEEPAKAPLRGNAAFHVEPISPVSVESPKSVMPAAYTAVESTGYSSVSDTTPAAPTAGVPTVALNGYCPVELLQNGRWVAGSVRWTVVHDGRIYRLSGESQRQQFLANPEAFAPVFSGNDPVVLAEEHRTAMGCATHCATYNNRLYMFSSPDTQARFNAAPEHYAEK